MKISGNPFTSQTRSNWYKYYNTLYTQRHHDAQQERSVRWIPCDFFPPLWRETKWMRFDLNDKRVRIKTKPTNPPKIPLILYS